MGKTSVFHDHLPGSNAPASAADVAHSAQTPHSADHSASSQIFRKRRPATFSNKKNKAVVKTPSSFSISWIFRERPFIPSKPTQRLIRKGAGVLTLIACAAFPAVLRAERFQDLVQNPAEEGENVVVPRVDFDLNTMFAQVRDPAIETVDEQTRKKGSIRGFHGQSGKRPPRRAITSVVWTGFVEREPPGL